MSKTIKIQIITDYQNYKKGQIIELDEKEAVTLLTNGKALKIHRKSGTDKTETTENKTEENSEENTKEKGNKKSK